MQVYRAQILSTSLAKCKSVVHWWCANAVSAGLPTARAAASFALSDSGRARSGRRPLDAVGDPGSSSVRQTALRGFPRIARRHCEQHPGRSSRPTRTMRFDRSPAVRGSSASRGVPSDGARLGPRARAARVDPLGSTLRTGYGEAAAGHSHGPRSTADASLRLTAGSIESSVASTKRPTTPS